MDDRLEVLLLCDYHDQSAGTIVDHILAFPKYSRHNFHVLSNRGNLPPGLDLERFDALVIHYSHVIAYDSYISKDARLAIRAFQGFKAVFIQDDYRWINRTVAALRYLKAEAVFCLAPQVVANAVYSPTQLPGVEKITTLAGYVAEALTRIEPKPYEDRTVDVGYRGRKLSAWIGSHAQEKWLIADKLLSDAPRFGLKCDVSCREEDRIYGDAWVEFIRNCKAMLGSESGSSICDFTGEIQQKVEAHEKAHPETSFEKLRDLYFRDADRKLMMNIISPRCFEAAALKTLMILYEGDYSGVLVPWRHYVSLRKDHSNMDEVVAALRDREQWHAIVENVYREVALNPKYSFRAMVEETDAVLSRGGNERRTVLGYSPADFERATHMAGALTVVTRAAFWRWAKERLKKFFLHYLRVVLVRVFAPLKNDRIRKALKALYFGTLGRAVVIAGRLAVSLNNQWGIISLGPARVIRVFANGKLSLSERVVLAKEVSQLVGISHAARGPGELFVQAEFHLQHRSLLIVGVVPDPVVAHERGPGEVAALLKAAKYPGLAKIEWSFQDPWELSPRLPVPDRIEFVALQKASQADPSFLATFLQDASCTVRTVGS